jgi:hypothetical protein
MRVQRFAVFVRLGSASDATGNLAPGAMLFADLGLLL